MVTGIASILIFPLAGVAAVIMGHIASKSQPHAKGFWLTGIITGYVAIGYFVLLIVFMIFWFAMMASVMGSYGGYSGY